jgi:hypothetical protein
MVRRGATLVCVVPFYVQSEGFSFEFSVWRTPSISTRALRVFGESIILADDVDAELCVSLVGDFLRRNSDSFDYFLIYGMKHADRFWQAALRNYGLSHHIGWKSVAMRSEKIHQVLLKNSFEDYVASLSPSTRQTLRYSHRRLFNDGSVRVQKCDRPAEVAQLLRWIVKIYSESWQAKTFGHPPQDDAAQQIFLEQTAAEGWLRSYVLLRGEEPLAYQFGYEYDRVYYLLDCAYSQQHAAASPGSVLSFSVFEDLHANCSVDRCDFGFGDMPYKRHFQSLELDASTVYFVPANRWRHALRLQFALNSTYDHLRNGLIQVRADRFVRKLIKRQK